MKAKYFTADTLEAACAEACNYFSCNESDLRIDVISGKDALTASADGTAPEPWVIVAIHGPSYEIDNMDSFYQLYYEADGVYLEIYEKRGLGKGVDDSGLIGYIKRKDIANINIANVQGIVAIGSGRTKIAPPQKENIIGEDMTVTVSADEKEAYARLLAPEPGGAPLSPADVKKKLAENGVIHGIDEEAMNIWLDAKVYDEPYAIANATMPVDGEDGKLIFHFSTDERTGKPRELEGTGGRVDYRLLDLYVPVEEGQLLVTRTAATEGSPGTTVKGNVIKQKPGKEAVMPRSKNTTVNEDRTEMRATCSGMVEYVNNSINVSNLYTVTGDCDISTGNIDFDGSVQISGSVRNGNTVKATGGILVGGSVEAATLIAGGNIEVKGGMQGADKGIIEAGGTVSLMFVERGKVFADGPIKVDVSIHSILETGSSIQALGKRGAIIGGQARAAEDIVTNYIGALSNTKTEVSVGFMPRKRARLEELEKDMIRLKADRTKLTQLDAYLEKTKGTMDQATWDKLNLSGAENKRLNDEAVTATEDEMKKLRFEMENATRNKVHVFETAFAGSRINIGASSLMVNDDINYATFKYNDGEVVYGSCEKSKTDFKV